MNDLLFAAALLNTPVQDTCTVRVLHSGENQILINGGWRIRPIKVSSIYSYVEYHKGQHPYLFRLIHDGSDDKIKSQERVTSQCGVKKTWQLPFDLHCNPYNRHDIYDSGSLPTHYGEGYL